MIEERYKLAIERVGQIQDERIACVRCKDYFNQMANFIQMIHELNQFLNNTSYPACELNILEEWNQALYKDILPEQYNKSYANPDYAVEVLGREYGQILSFLYTELRGSIAYAYDRKTKYQDILFELFLEVYMEFSEQEEPDVNTLKEIIYWYASDYSDVFAADKIVEQIDPLAAPFAVDIIRKSDLTDIRYLYWFGEYVGENEIQTAEHLNQLEETVIDEMASVYTEGFRTGFVNTGKDLSKKKVVTIRYVLGFERVIRKAIDNFESMGLQVTIFRSSVSAITKRQHLKNGYYGGIPNKQYEYDHRNDQGLFLDKRYVERKLSVLHNTYESKKEQALQFAGPAVTEVFGEVPFVPRNKESAVAYSDKQEELMRFYESRAGQITNCYIPGENRSFTIIAYPVPEIGIAYKEIFNEIIRINTLDADTYTKVQQTLIDALDQGDYVHIVGANGNQTDLQVQLFQLKNAKKETIFENCVADVNIPVGEVFTTPVLAGTNGKLHVSKVYLNGLQYIDLEMDFANGMIADYSCKNFERELDNKKYVKDHILKNHPTLPLGEFAIGTNTTAFVVAKKYGIEDKLPILIAEKMGPHFAVGDTCYSWSEDVKVYNPSKKEMVARDNAISALRHEDVSKAYFQCHTDITIPYDELGSITVVTSKGEEIRILEQGMFVLSGTEILNEPLKNVTK